MNGSQPQSRPLWRLRFLTYKRVGGGEIPQTTERSFLSLDFGSFKLQWSDELPEPSILAGNFRDLVAWKDKVSGFPSLGNDSLQPHL